MASGLVGAAGVVVFGVVSGVVPVAALLPVAFTAPVVGELEGVAAGNVVIGVGKAGSGLASMPAIISFRPVSELSWRYLYHWLKLSIHSFLAAAYAASVPARATARA